MYVERVIVLFMRLVIRTAGLERQGCDASLFVRSEIISRNEYRKMLNVIISYDHYRNSSDLINSRDWSFIYIENDDISRRKYGYFSKQIFWVIYFEYESKRKGIGNINYYSITFFV